LTLTPVAKNGAMSAQQMRTRNITYFTECEDKNVQYPSGTGIFNSNICN